MGDFHALNRPGSTRKVSAVFIAGTVSSHKGNLNSHRHLKLRPSKSRSSAPRHL